MLGKFEAIAEDIGEEAAWAVFDEEEKKVFGEFLVHGKAIREERARASKAGEEPNFIPLVRNWGGVSWFIASVYRIRPLSSESRGRQKASKKELNFVELMSPTEAVRTNTARQKLRF